ncbi:methylenetetrahydrofolate reductase [NAD(P)H] [Pseudodesulfovibrio sp. JC047]|uniref:methylenetetrahydrofolate reductase n=1 Tax=Pseudodesulfovibrio sp. JC047 TaxID=2683199 RepID=UPI0013D3E93F|nr:methylenetetrahydrofolate reductase [Pseudodesulfovibrio sp. JC047]NDV19456.1 methylenetetrahydrofolate reductase [NAD(P)H] [Pseudodesulfovibrio sp. JC047]
MRIIDLIHEREGKPFVSFEFFPPKEEAAMPGFYDTAKQLKALDPLFVSVTYGAGGGAQDNTLGIVSGLQKDEGFETMSHLTCVQASEDRIAGYLDQLGAVGSSNVLALRGDPPKGGSSTFVPDNERFKHASDLIEYIREIHPEICIGVACYPDPHPESPSVREDLNWTAHKLELADFATTQLFFDNRVYFELVEKLADKGVNKPVIPAVLPIPSVQSAKFILGLCGAMIPGKFLLALEKADAEGGVEAAAAVGRDFARRQIEDLLAKGAPGVHLYTLNRAEHCLKVMEGLTF